MIGARRAFLKAIIALLHALDAAYGRAPSPFLSSVPHAHSSDASAPACDHRQRGASGNRTSCARPGYCMECQSVWNTQHIMAGHPVVQGEIVDPSPTALAVSHLQERRVARETGIYQLLVNPTPVEFGTARINPFSWGGT